MIIFGGVHDEYEKDDLKSTFYNDVYSFRMDQQRWYPLKLRGSGKKGGSRRAKDKSSRSDGSSMAGSSLAGDHEDDEEMAEAIEFTKVRVKDKPLYLQQFSHGGVVEEDEYDYSDGSGGSDAEDKGGYGSGR
eukprot:CAMPEP_0206285110 /NCGR_PEP_ID=MMETSP0047_2-20121206/41138_1 /ASSEMBLY_ACC=CAM_ASM_000192 /TAXON_ID=195065 /ORGANISM="Chroomonas mesostigmatica_cf, Strain CCMP1168" /LENGTH=131 /DNA_ID=CAMNT_0053715619 /DNA_START=128 /DNA_END=519 /DNA_ORIENTATION=+